MSHLTCPLFAGTLAEEREFGLDDYEGAIARWCSGCGDHSVLAATQRLLRDEQLPPERTMFVSGIGCSSRFPHYLKTYGFHGLHGWALPVATGIKLARPDLTVFVVMGDGDCCSIGAGHWVHAVRYNMDMTALLLDNAIYGLTKNQTSPTTPEGYRSNTHPRGSRLPPLNPLTATLGFTNASFVAQTAEWIPAHLAATLEAAYRHRGFGFVRILQRCPEYTPDLYEDLLRNPEDVELLIHDDGISVPSLEQVHPTRSVHDPRDLDRARALAEDVSRIRLGVFFRDPDRPLYEDRVRPSPRPVAEKIERLNRELDRHAV
jgi:2-oxoglutarate/2-oxoacid ferredoxin oxidoreductase subunit beta